MAGKAIDLTGQKFNMLTVIRRSEKTDASRRAYWECQCDCGQITIVKGTAIRKGETKSCGCLQRTRSAEVNRKDLTNQKFGYLTAISPTEDRSSGSVIWKCKCQCGKIISVRATSLLSGHTNSCGCMVESKGELAIKKLLLANKILFDQEAMFDSCIYPETNGQLRFDFYIDNSYLIEFDGKQHFQDTIFFGEDNKLEET